MREKTHPFHGIAAGAWHFFSGTLISRLFGFARELCMAVFFGASAPYASFLIAFRFTQLFRRLFGESTLAQGFVPHFEKLKNVDPKHAALYFRDLVFSLGMFLLILIGLTELVLFAIEPYVSAYAQEIIHCCHWMLPGIFFICLYALFAALLQCQRHFFLPAVAPIAFNVVWIGVAMLTKDLPLLQAIRFLCMGVSVAYFLQWVILLPHALRFTRGHLGIKEHFRAQIFSEAVLKMASPLVLTALGTGALQINGAIDLLFARRACLEGPAYLGYAIRLYQFPLALIGAALSSALLPSLSRAFAKESQKEFNEIFHYGEKKALLLLVPACCALFALSLAFVSFSYAYGKFDSLAVKETSKALWAYSLGIVPHGLVMIYSSSVYARLSFRAPMIGALLSIGVNIVLNSIFIYGLKAGPESVAFATSMASVANALYLRAQIKVEPSGNSNKNFFIIKVGVATLLALLATLLVGKKIFHDPTLDWLMGLDVAFVKFSFMQQMQRIFSEMAVFILVYFILGTIFKIISFPKINKLFSKTYKN